MSNLDKTFYIEIGRILQDARLRNKYSYDTLSSKIDGIKTKSTLKRYEEGESRIDQDTLNVLCNALGLDMEETLTLATDRASNGYNKSYNPKDTNRDLDTICRLLDDIGHSVGFDDEDAFLWVNYSNGTLEVTHEMLIELYRDINVFLRYKLMDVKEKHIEDFKEYKK